MTQLLTNTSIKTLIFEPVRPLTFKEKKQIFDSKAEYENFVAETGKQEFAKVSAKLRSLNKTRRLNPELKKHANAIVASNVNAALAKLLKNKTSKPPQNQRIQDKTAQLNSELRELRRAYAKLTDDLARQTAAFDKMEDVLRTSLLGRMTIKEFSALVPPPTTVIPASEIAFKAIGKSLKKRQRRRANRAKKQGMKKSPTKILKQQVARMSEPICSADEESAALLAQFVEKQKLHPQVDAFQIIPGSKYNLIPNRNKRGHVL